MWREGRVGEARRERLGDVGGRRWGRVAVPASSFQLPIRIAYCMPPRPRCMAGCEQAAGPGAPDEGGSHEAYRPLANDENILARFDVREANEINCDAQRFL